MLMSLDSSDYSEDTNLEVGLKERNLRNMKSTFYGGRTGI
jgi:hypothetical protein